jgi:uncharacterized membrane protein YhaH (DUF805 family)
MMGFGESISTCLRKYAVSSGRARRSEYWWFWLACAILSLVFVVLDGILFPGNEIGVLSTILTLGLFLPSLGATIRRLHDTDRSGWWVLVGLIPLAGIVVLLVFMALDGTKGTNRFGDDPKSAAGAEVFA